MVPENRSPACATIPTAARTSDGWYWRMSMPSSSSSPEVGRKSLPISRPIVVLPEPMRPMMPIRSPGFTEKFSAGQNLVFGTRIDKADILERHRAVANGAVDEADRVRPVLRLRHDRVDNSQRQHGLAKSGQGDGDLAKRRHRPAGQHDGADDRAGRDMPFRKGVGAGHDQGDGHQLLDGPA